MGPKNYLERVHEALVKDIGAMREAEAKRLEPKEEMPEIEEAWSEFDVADFKYDYRRENQ